MPAISVTGDVKGGNSLAGARATKKKEKRAMKD